MRSHRLFVLHIQEGTESGTDSWFHNPAAQVSSNFGNPKVGEMDQWVDTDDTAWAEAAYNDVGISVEHEGRSGDSLTPSQLENDAQCLAWAHVTHGTKLQVTDDPNGEGVIGHGQLGVAGGNHPDCPGQPILDQRQAIVDRAKQILGDTPSTPTPSPQLNYPAYPGHDFVYSPGVEPSYDRAVEVWQQRMKDRGWNIKPDGFYGPKSEGVCRAFQEDSTHNGWWLLDDGEVGRNTWRATWERPVSR